MSSIRLLGMCSHLFTLPAEWTRPRVWRPTRRLHNPEDGTILDICHIICYANLWPFEVKLWLLNSRIASSPTPVALWQAIFDPDNNVFCPYNRIDVFCKVREAVGWSLDCGCSGGGGPPLSATLAGKLACWHACRSQASSRSQAVKCFTSHLYNEWRLCAWCRLLWMHINMCVL